MSADSLAERIIPADGVVPPSGMPAHNSTLSAPPSPAAMQLRTELAQISILNSSLFIYLNIRLQSLDCLDNILSKPDGVAFREEYHAVECVSDKHERKPSLS